MCDAVMDRWNISAMCASVYPFCVWYVLIGACIELSVLLLAGNYD